MDQGGCLLSYNQLTGKSCHEDSMIQSKKLISGQEDDTAEVHGGAGRVPEGRNSVTWQVSDLACLFHLVPVFL